MVPISYGVAQVPGLSTIQLQRMTESKRQHNTIPALSLKNISRFSTSLPPNPTFHPPRITHPAISSHPPLSQAEVQTTPRSTVSNPSSHSIGFLYSHESLHF